MSFKLIARDNKINIYDAYADKYHVVENDEELSKLIDENGKLLPDEQLRQYFATKESKSRKIQKGFTTKKANLKKEYGDVEKQIFKDVVKYKIYSKYGKALSNDDINAFNKNPSAETIKKFKSLRSEIRDEAADTFKEYEKQYQQDYNDKNNLASILSAYQQMNKDTPLSQVMMTSVILQMMKSDINAAKTNNEEQQKEAIKKIKENAALPMLPMTIQNAIKKLDIENIDTKELEEVIDKEEKKMEVKKEREKATKYQIPGEVLYGNAREQFDKSNTLKKFDITPLQTLHKNLIFLNSSEDKFNTLNDMKIEEQPNKPTNIELKFGDNGEFQFKYTIDPGTPYYNEIIPAIKTLEEKPNYEEFQKAYSDMEDRIDNFDSANYTVNDKNSSNDYKFTNEYNLDKDKYKNYPDNYDIVKEQKKNAQIMKQMSDPKFDVEEFQTYINAITGKKWFDKMEPTIEFDIDSESSQYKKFNRDNTDEINKKKLPRNAFIHAMENPDKHFYQTSQIVNNLSKIVDEKSAEYVNKLKEEYAEYQEALKKDEDAVPPELFFNYIKSEKDIDKIPEILKATILHQKIIGDEMPDSLPSDKGFTQLNRKTGFQFAQYHNIMRNVHKDKSHSDIYDTIKIDKDFQKLYEDISDAVDENLNKGYYWYYDTDTINQQPMRFYDNYAVRMFPQKKKGIFNSAKKYNEDDLDNDINVISREIYNPYGYKYVDESYFSKGMIRDMLALKLNKK